MSGDDSDEPDWGLLPWEPERFFGLVQPYTLLDLKRRYNQRLRRYKPDRHMAEFMRLRAAYEALERKLRGMETASPSPAQFWTPPEISESPPQPESVETPEHLPSDAVPITGDDFDAVPMGDDDPFANVAPPLDVWRTDDGPGPRRSPTTGRPVGESLDDTLKFLREDPTTKPSDYVRLALEIDVRPFRTFEFLRVLLAGLSRWSANVDLNCLLGEFLELGPEGNGLVEALRQAASTLPAEQFFGTTTGGWCRLLAAVPSSEFLRVFDDCNERVGGYLQVERANLICQVLDTLMWDADGDWIEAELTRFDAEFVDRNPRFADLLHRLELLWKYVRSPARRLGRTWLRERFEQLVREYFHLQSDRYSENFLRFQAEIRLSESTWLNGLPPAFHIDLAPTIDLYLQMDWSVDARLVSGLYHDGHRMQEDDQLVEALMIDDHRGWRWWREQPVDWAIVLLRGVNSGWYWGQTLLILTFLVVVGVFALLGSVVDHLSGSVDLFFNGAMLIGGPSAFFAAYVVAYRVAPLVEKWCEACLIGLHLNRIPERYQSRFRRRFLDRMTDWGWGYRTSLDRLNRVKHKLPERTKLMIDLWSRDFGAALALTARLYATCDSPNDMNGQSSPRLDSSGPTRR